MDKNFKEFESLIKLAIELTGSIMKPRDIWDTYITMSVYVRNDLYKQFNKVILGIKRIQDSIKKKGKIVGEAEGNVVFGLLTVETSIIFFKDNVDPAIVFISGIDESNKKV